MRFSDTNPTLWIIHHRTKAQKTNKGFVFEERERKREREESYDETEERLSDEIQVVVSSSS